MSKTKIILIIILLLVIALGLFWWFSGGDGEVGETDSENRGFLGIFPRRDPSPEEPASKEGDENLSEGDGLIDEVPRPIPVFRQISFKPISGFGVFEQNGSTTIRFLETESGHIFEAKTDNLEVTRISNTTIPRIRDVLWSESGDSLLIRYLDEEATIQSFVTNLSREEGDEFFELESSVLSENISSVDVFNNSFFAVIESSNGSDWSIFNSSGAKSSVASSPLKGWLVDFWSSNRVSIQTKSSFKSSGSLYFLNLNNITLTEILSYITGLSSLTSPSGDFVIYSSSSGSDLETNILSVDDGKIVPLTIKTLGEKCVWENDEEFVYCAVPKIVPRELPDSWYKGQVLFNDDIWKIETDGTAEKLYDPTNDGTSIDAYNLQISNDDRFIYFINKIDNTLWSFDLED